MKPPTDTKPVANGAIRIDSYLSAGDERSLAEDVLDGLTRPFKELPPKHFYDARGAELFDRICELPEYYPTRTERAILLAHADAIVATNDAAELVELGSGTAAKTRVLLDAMQEAGTLRRYVPFDVTEAVVRDCAETLGNEYPGLEGRGTIGNFTPGSRRRFLRSIGKLLGPGDSLLLGTDLVKDPGVIEAAYDDAQGVTAEFNRNVLHVLNRELGADFDVDDFDHVATFDEHHEWIEMRLRARSDQEVTIADLDLVVEFEAGEELRTEITAKFTRPRLEGDLAAAGMELVSWHTDADALFALSLAQASG